MRALHLQQIGDTWHYQRRRPKDYADVEPRALIRFSLRTQDFREATILAAEHTIALERQWAEALERGVSLKSTDKAEQFAAAAATARRFGFAPRSARELSDEDLLARLRTLMSAPSSTSPEEGKAVLGMVDKPKLTLSQAFDRFWAHIEE